MNPRLSAVLWLVVDVAAPVVVYSVLHAFGVGDVLALTLGGLVSGLGVIAASVRRRHLDRIGLLVLLMFGLTLALVAVTGDPRFVLAKPAVFTLAAGVYCLVTLRFGRPIAYDTARPFAVGDTPEAVQSWERAWTGSPELRRALWTVTAVWGIALLVDSVGRVVVTYTLALPTAVWAVQVPGLALVVAAAYGGRRLRSLRPARSGAVPDPTG